MDSTDPMFDEVCATTMNAALTAHPNTLIVFGRHNRVQWLTHCADLPMGASIDELRGEDLAYESVELAVTIVDGHKMRVLFATHPSAWMKMGSMLYAILCAHFPGLDKQEAADKAAAFEKKMTSSVIESVKEVGTASIMQVEVDSNLKDQRFVLSEGVITHTGFVNQFGPLFVKLSLTRSKSRARLPVT
jgi:hypothetical protein